MVLGIERQSPLGELPTRAALSRFFRDEVPAKQSRSDHECNADVGRRPLVAPEPASEPREHCGFSRDRSEEHRLNSSHSQISYAVFCLKKKIHTLSILTRLSYNYYNIVSTRPARN